MSKIRLSRRQLRKLIREAVIESDPGESIEAEMSEKDFAIQSLTASIKILGGQGTTMGSALKNIRKNIRNNEWKGAKEDYTFINDAFKSNTNDLQDDYGITPSEISTVKDALKLAGLQLQAISKQKKADQAAISKYQSPEEVDWDAAGEQYAAEKAKKEKEQEKLDKAAEAAKPSWAKYLKSKDKSKQSIGKAWLAASQGGQIETTNAWGETYKPTFNGWVKLYNDLRKDEEQMAKINKKVNDHISPREMISLMREILPKDTPGRKHLAL